MYKVSVIGGQSSSGTAINIFLHFCVWLYLLSVFVFRPGEEYMGTIIGGNPILVKTFWDNQYFIAHLSLCFFLFFVFVFKFQLEKLYMGWVIGGKSNCAYLCIYLCLCRCSFAFVFVFHLEKLYTGNWRQKQLCIFMYLSVSLSLFFVFVFVFHLEKLYTGRVIGGNPSPSVGKGNLGQSAISAFFQSTLYQCQPTSRKQTEDLRPQ